MGDKCNLIFLNGNRGISRSHQCMGSQSTNVSLTFRDMATTPISTMLLPLDYLICKDSKCTSIVVVQQKLGYADF